MSEPGVGPGFVTAFAGRRDAYQAAVALAEGGRLDRLVTSFYLTPGWERAIRAVAGRVPAGVRTRQADGLPAGRVVSLLGPELVEQVGRRLGVRPQSYWRLANRWVGSAAATTAAAHRSDLLLYEPYAPAAFRRRYPRHTPRKVLFHFHAHPDLEAAIYQEDVRRAPPATPWQTPDGSGGRDDADARAVRRVWADADLIVCASSFTRRSLLHAGADPARCRVVPYGIDVGADPPPPPSPAGDGRFRPLFVGTGIQRKGLHHLLEAWRRARLPAGAELTLVCRGIDPQLRDRAAATAGVRLLAGVSAGALTDLYRAASILVVPSLVEGFGQVYLEALARGCPVLGTDNTCLPDLGDEADGLFLTAPSDPDHLAARLEELAVLLPTRPDLRAVAWATARRFSWPRFRQGLREAIEC